MEEEKLAVLQAAFPTEKERETISRLSSTSVASPLIHDETLPLDLIKNLGQELSLDNLLDDYEETTRKHPVLMACRMLHLASYIRSYAVISPLGSYDVLTLEVLISRLQEVVQQQVTTAHCFPPSIELLHCTMLERAIFIDQGRFKDAHKASRRSIKAAQALSLDSANLNSCNPTKLHHETVFDVEHMWGRIIYYDRILCLLRGKNVEMVSYRSIGSFQRLGALKEPQRSQHLRIQLISLIMHRNIGPQPYNYDESIAINSTLEEEFPTLRKWILPGLSEEARHNERRATEENSAKAIRQAFDYKIMLHIFMPFMFQHCDEDATSLTDISPSHQTLEALDRGLEAARDIVAHFHVLFKQSGYSHMNLVYLAIVHHAALILLLVHAEVGASTWLARNSNIQDDWAVDFMLATGVARTSKAKASSLSGDCVEELTKLTSLLETNKPSSEVRCRLRRIAPSAVIPESATACRLCDIAQLGTFVVIRDGAVC